MLALDTSILARLVATDHPAQTKAAVELIDGGGVFFIPLTVALELEWVLRAVFKLRRDAVAKSFEGLMSVRNLHFEQRGFVQAALQLHATGFDFADALHQACADGCDALLTFDDDFAKRGGALNPPVRLPQS